MPTVAAGGSKATATMTPTKTLDKPVVSESAAAAPDASASATESIPTTVHDNNSVLKSSVGHI